jgi:hypothetical protein
MFNSVLTFLGSIIYSALANLAILYTLENLCPNYWNQYILVLPLISLILGLWFIFSKHKNIKVGIGIVIGGVTPFIIFIILLSRMH